MIPKHLRFYIISFLSFISSLVISSVFFLNYQKNLAITEINHSVSKRLLDYQNVFSIIKAKIINIDDMRILSSYSQQQIYLAEGYNITFGETECKFINKISNQELSGWNNPSPSLQDLLLKTSLVALTSHAYHSLDIAPELLVDIGYSFELDNYKCLLKTTVLLKDLLIYSPHALSFISKLKLKSFSLFLVTYHHPELDIYLGIELSYTSLLLYILGCFIFYILCMFLYSTRQAHTKNLHLKEENKNLIQAIEDLKEKDTTFEHLCVGEILEIKKNSHLFSQVCLADIIQSSLAAHKEKIINNAINFAISEQYSSLTIETKKPYLSLFFNLFIQNLVKQCPPNSTVTCTISIENKEDGCSVTKIVFQDDLTFTSGVNKSFFTSTIQLPSSINIVINDLIEELDMFVEFTTSSQGGNKTVFAIPSLNKTTGFLSNVIPLSR